MAKLLYDDEYTGPRWRYGSLYRPIVPSTIPANMAEAFVILAGRPDTRYPTHGTIVFARELTGRECEHFDLVLLGAE